MSGGNYVGGPAWASQADMDIAGAAMARSMRRPSYGAIAYSPATGRYGWSYKADERATAENLAIQSCGAADAITLVWGSDVYLALALGEGGAYGSAWNTRRAAAEQQALQVCSRSGTNCQVALVFDTRRDPTSRRGSRRVRGVILAVIAVAFALGAAYDLASGKVDARPSLVIAIVAGLLAAYQLGGR